MLLHEYDMADYPVVDVPQTVWCYGSPFASSNRGCEQWRVLSGANSRSESSTLYPWTASTDKRFNVLI